MSIHERAGLSGWAIVGLVAAVALWFFVVQPFVCASFKAAVDELAHAEDVGK